MPNDEYIEISKYTNQFKKTIIHDSKGQEKVITTVYPSDPYTNQANEIVVYSQI